MDQNVILQGFNLARSRSSVKVKKKKKKKNLNVLSDPRHLPISTRDVSSKCYCQFFRYGIPIVDRMMARKRKKTKTLLLMLALCDANYAMKERPDVK